jgi:hypothetical protein
MPPYLYVQTTPVLPLRIADSVPGLSTARNAAQLLHKKEQLSLLAPFFLSPHKCPLDTARMDRDVEMSLDALCESH